MFKGLGGLGGLGDIGKMMKAAQEMQERMGALQGQLDQISVEGSSGGGLVKATANGKGELSALSIDPSIFRAEDREMVEDLILAAVRDAQARATERMNDEMAKLTGGMGMPPGFGG